METQTRRGRKTLPPPKINPNLNYTPSHNLKINKTPSAHLMPPQPSHSKHSPSQHLNFKAPLSRSLPRLFSDPDPKINSNRQHQHVLHQTSQPQRRPTRTHRNHSVYKKIESPISDHQLKTTLKPLSTLKMIDNHKNVSNPYLFRGAPIVTTIVRSISSRTNSLKKPVERRAELNTPRIAELNTPRIAELNTPRSKKNYLFLFGLGPIYVHPSFHMALKLKYLLDVGGISRDGRVTTELSTGSLRHAAGILTLEDFQPVVDSE